VIDLVFRRLRSGTHPVDLVFGEPAGPVVDATGALDIALPGFAPSFDGLLDYDLAVSGSDVIGTAASWQPAVPVIAPTLHARHATGQQTRIARRAPWGGGRRVVVGDLEQAERRAGLVARVDGRPPQLRQHVVDALPAVTDVRHRKAPRFVFTFDGDDQVMGLEGAEPVNDGWIFHGPAR